jgi:hypothetical protein
VIDPACSEVATGAMTGETIGETGAMTGETTGETGAMTGVTGVTTAVTVVPDPDCSDNHGLDAQVGSALRLRLERMEGV